MRRLIFPLIFGLAGAAILIWLGTWQVQRLAWKEQVLADIKMRIAADPVPLPAAPDPEVDQYLPVQVVGNLVGPSLQVLVSQKNIGAGYRIITAMDIEGRRILVDRGFVRIGSEVGDTPTQAITLTGNLHWPNEIDSYTPAPDLDRNIWFARDVGEMAAALKTENILIVARSSSAQDTELSPLPVSVTGIPNDHLNYAITWYSLAIVWLAMAGTLIWRPRRTKKAN